MNLFALDTQKIDKLLCLLDNIDYDAKTNTLVINGDVNIIIKGNYNMETEKHLNIASNYTETDPELNIPYCVFINSTEQGILNVQNQAKRIINDDCNCGGK